MGILRTDRVAGLGGADAIKGSVKFTSGGALDIDLDGTSIGTSNFTIEAWVFWFGNGSHQFTGSSSNNFNFYIADDDGDLKFYNGSSTYDFDASPVRANEWTHVALVREGTSSSATKVYVNGVNTNTVTLNTSFSFDRLLSGINYLDGSRGYGNGYTSNLRFTLDAVYTSAFTPPNREFTVLDNTIVLCCQSPGNILQEATGKTVVVFKHGLNQGDPVASHFTPNSPVGFSTTTDVGTQFGSTFDGVTTFDSQAYFVPPGGNTRERNRGRGVISGGRNRSTMEFINIQSQGNSQEFGDSVTGDGIEGFAVGSSTRGLFSGPQSPLLNVIEFITFATQSNGTDFGDTTSARRSGAGAGNDTRGLFAGGIYQASSPYGGINITDFVTIATAGNATDFGDLNTANEQAAPNADTTRVVIAGGTVVPSSTNVIDFFTIATTGNATDFGDMTTTHGAGAGGASSSTRGLIAGGTYDDKNNHIDFITIQTTGNSTDFGDLTSAKGYPSGMSNSTRGVFAGGYQPTQINAIDFVNIATTGDANDFGDLSLGANFVTQATSDCHGGLS